jgi:uridine kinase
MGESVVPYSVSTWQQPMPAPSSPHRTDLIAGIAAELGSTRPDRLLVADDGRTGAGKTSFGHELGSRWPDWANCVPRLPR